MLMCTANETEEDPVGMFDASYAEMFQLEKEWGMIAPLFNPYSHNHV